MSARRIVESDATHQVWILLFNAFSRLTDHTPIFLVDSAIAIEVIHAAVAIVVYIPIHRVTIHVPRQRSPAAGAAPFCVVKRCAKSTDHADVFCWNATRVELLNRELEFIEQLW